MALEIILATLAALLSLFFIRWAKRQQSSSAFFPMPELESLLRLIFGGLPLSAVLCGVLVVGYKLFKINIDTKNSKLITGAFNAAVVIQWIVWSQLIVFLVRRF